MCIVTDIRTEDRRPILRSPDLERVHGSETTRKESLTISVLPMLLGRYSAFFRIVATAPEKAFHAGHTSTSVLYNDVLIERQGEIAYVW